MSSFTTAPGDDPAAGQGSGWAQDSGAPAPEHGAAEGYGDQSAFHDFSAEDGGRGAAAEGGGDEQRWYAEWHAHDDDAAAADATAVQGFEGYGNDDYAVQYAEHQGEQHYDGHAASAAAMALGGQPELARGASPQAAEGELGEDEDEDLMDEIARALMEAPSSPQAAQARAAYAAEEQHYADGWGQAVAQSAAEPPAGPQLLHVASNATAISTPWTPSNYAPDPSLHGTAARHSKRGLQVDEYAHEGLGESFESTPYVQPSVPVALKARRLALYSQGKRLPICSTDVSGASGVGTALYFAVLRYMMLLLLAMSLLAAPVIMFAAHGSHVANEDMDSLGSARLSIGNLGAQLPVDNPDTNVSACQADLLNRFKCNSTYMDVFGARVSTLFVSYTITSLDVLASLLFFLFWRWLRRTVHRLVQRAENSVTTTAEYSVFVRGLPGTCTEAEVRDHFSNLFGLAAPAAAAAERSKLQRAGSTVRLLPTSELPEPVKDCSHNGDSSYLGSWVADVALVTQPGAALRAFLRAQKLVQRLRVARAHVKRAKLLAESSKFDMTGDIRSARNKVLQLSFELSEVHKRVQKVLADARRGTRAGAPEQECHGAFVTFNHRQSMMRCVRAYVSSSHWLTRVCQRRALRFGGQHTLSVSAAPQPADILWEHLDTPFRSRMLRRLATAGIALLVLCVTFGLLLFAQVTNTEFQSKIPNLALCDQELPALYLGSYRNVTSERTLFRPGTFKGEFDTACAEQDIGGFYVQFQGAILPSSPTACRSSRCPNPRASSNCPCMLPASTEACSTLPCLVPEEGAALGRRCETFPASTITGCYCLTVLRQQIDARGALAGISQMMRDEKDSCGEFATAYVTAQSLTLAVAGSIVILNTVLMRVLQALSRFERHFLRSTEIAASVSKAVAAQFVNTAVITLVVNARLPNDRASPLAAIGVLNGKHDDFTSLWYAEVGGALVFTMLLNAVLPHLETMLYAVIVPLLCRRRRARRAVTQMDLDSAYAPPELDLGSRYVYVMTTLFVTMTYSGGLPVLLVLAFASITVLYCLDKILLLRVYARPPPMSASLARLFVSSLPWALLLHLAVTAWMLGNESLLSSNLLNPKWLAGKAGASASSLDVEYRDWLETNPLGVAARLVRNNVFPLAVGAVLLVIIMVLETAGVAASTVWRAFCCCFTWRRASKVSPRTENRMPAFTGEYFTVLTAKQAKSLQASMHASKYELMPLPSGEFLAFERRSKGTPVAVRRRTWESIQHKGMLHSYRPEDHPLYKQVLHAQQVSSEVADTDEEAGAPRHAASHQPAPPAIDEGSVDASNSSSSSSSSSDEE